jgi:hypothetical protein
MKNRIAIIILSVLIGWAVLQTLRVNILKQKNEALQVEKSAAVDIAVGKSQEVDRYINELGNEVVKVRESELTVKGLNELIESNRLKYIKELEAARKSNKNVVSIGSIDTHINTGLINKKDTVFTGDTFQVFEFSLKDNWNDIHAFVIDTPTFKIRMPIYIGETWTRKKILWLRIGKKVYEREVTSPNKLVSVDSVFFYSVKK